MEGVRLRLRTDLRTRWRAVAVITLLTGIFGGLALATAIGARRTATAYSRLTAAAPDYDVFLVPEEAVDELAGRCTTRSPGCRRFSARPGSPHTRSTVSTRTGASTSSSERRP